MRRDKYYTGDGVVPPLRPRGDVVTFHTPPQLIPPRCALHILPIYFFHVFHPFSTSPGDTRANPVYNAPGPLLFALLACLLDLFEVGEA